LKHILAHKRTLKNSLNSAFIHSLLSSTLSTNMKNNILSEEEEPKLFFSAVAVEKSKPTH